MKKIRVIIMGKTGVGKSTIINSVLGEKIAETGDGAAITRENKIYECKRLIDLRKSNEDGKYSKVNCSISLYDTVGLEIDRSITRETLQNVKKHIEEAKKNSNEEDVNIVWFCINERSNRFESYEADLIKQLSIEYEIPFVIVLTQCISKKNGALTEEIHKKMLNVPIKRIMASDYPFDDEITIKSFGLEELLQLSIKDYCQYRINVIESIIDELTIRSGEQIKKVVSKGKRCIFDYSEQAGKIGWVPGGCIPFVHGKCVKMIADLNDIGGLSKEKSFADEVFTGVVLGIFVTPLMAVPLLSKFAAESYIETVGDNYLKAMISVIESSSEMELKDKRIMKERMKLQLKKNG